EAKLTALGIVPQSVVCNQLYPNHFPPGTPVARVLETLLLEDPAHPSPLLRELVEHASLSRDRRALNERYLAELRRRTKAPVVELPMVFSQKLAPVHVVQLGQALDAKL
ncbi:MAG: hypothetical protein H0T65_24255, partial [Deltaproteobacteria bacterium]|nr:hypothetical protein [Deltaproteobacteria bacterium]